MVSLNIIAETAERADISWSADEPEHLQINAAVTEIIEHFSEGTDPDNPHDFMVAMVLAAEAMNIAQQYAHDNGKSRIASILNLAMLYLLDYLEADHNLRNNYPELMSAIDQNCVKD